MSNEEYSKRLAIRLTQQQYDFLKAKENASEWLRDVIQSKMSQEDVTDPLAILSRIKALELERQRIFESEQFQLAKKAADGEFTEQYQGAIGNPPKALLTLYQNDTLSIHRKEEGGFRLYVYSDSLRHYFPHAGELLTKADVNDFMIENKLKLNADGEGFYPRETALKLFDKLKERIAFMRKVYEKYSTRLAEIQSEIDALKRKVMAED